MKVALVRHFKVNDQKPNSLLTAAEFSEWIDHYNEATILPIQQESDHGQWDLCYTSDLMRAFHTAKRICDCEIIETPLLREIPLAAFSKRQFKLPLAVWNFAGRFAWFSSHSSQEETREQTKRRVRKFLDLLESRSEENILVVSHGFFLIELSKALQQSGYVGKRKRRWKNGEMIIYEFSAEKKVSSAQ